MRIRFSCHLLKLLCNTDEAFTSENWIVRIYQVKKPDVLGRPLPSANAFVGHFSIFAMRLTQLSGGRQKGKEEQIGSAKSASAKDYSVEMQNHASTSHLRLAHSSTKWKKIDKVRQKCIWLQSMLETMHLLHAQCP